MGCAVGYGLSRLPRIESDRLLNVAGLSYTLLGVLVLSEVLAGGTWKNFCVKFLAPGVLWFHSIVSIGALLGSGLLARHMDRPSWSVTARWSFGFFLYSIFPLAFLDEMVVLPRLRFVKRDIQTRWQWLGFCLILTGVALELVGAILGFSRE